MRDDAEQLARLLSLEVGKPLGAARDEVLSAASLFDFFAEEASRLSGRIPLLGMAREQVMILREPVGVVVAITPFNYPLSTLAAKVAPALAVGCTVVAKPDEHTPASTLEVARLAAEAGLPTGVFNVLVGDGPSTGRHAVNHPLPRMVTFTGSTAVGKEIQRLCAERVKRVVLELGGNCPAIVCADAPWQDLMPQLIAQSYKNSGQYCYRISRFYVAEQIFDDFVEAFARASESLIVGHAQGAETDLGPLNNAEILSRVESQVQQAIREGAQVCTGSDGARPRSSGFYFPPTVLSDQRRVTGIRLEEVFGPVVVVMPFQDSGEAIADANASPFGLAGYVFTKDLALALELVGRLEVGSIWVNKIHQAYAEVPFGGMKESGLGREKSGFGLEEFTELKSVYLSY
jgi:succinate-semialdehyde dehydrogenase/glutarate-semialdehyde dehydrogenase